MIRLVRPLWVLLLAVALARGAGEFPTAPALKYSELPRWESSASGPLRPTNSVPAGGGSGGLGDLVVTCNNFEIDSYSHVGPINGALRFTVPFETAQGWTGYALEGQSAPADVGGVMSQEYVIVDPGTGGNLVMMFNYGSEFLSFSDLWTDHPSVQNYFGPYSGTLSVARITAGPPEIDLETVDPLLPSSRNWYREWLQATNPPAATPGSAVYDALILPVGIVTPIRDTPGALVEVLVAEPPMLRALVQRYRSGLAPTNIPVRAGHTSTVVGAVTDLWWVEGQGVWVRMRVEPAFAGRMHPSCELMCLRAQASDEWGAWGDFHLPWQITGVGLVESPALALPVVRPSVTDPPAPYPGKLGR